MKETYVLKAKKFLDKHGKITTRDIVLITGTTCPHTVIARLKIICPFEEKWAKRDLKMKLKKGMDFKVFVKVKNKE